MRLHTGCPHCNTLFNISATQLRSADGTVRCGHCMRIFNALEYLNDGRVGGNPPTSSGPEIAPADRGLPSTQDSSTVEQHGDRSLYRGILPRRQWTLADLGDRSEAVTGLEAPLGPVESNAHVPPIQPEGSEEHSPIRSSERAEESRKLNDSRLGAAPEDHVLEALEDLRGIVSSFGGGSREPGVPSLELEEQPPGPDQDPPDGWLDVSEFHAAQTESDGADDEPDEGWDDGEQQRVPDVLRADVSRMARKQMQGGRRILYAAASLLLLVGLFLQYAWFMPDDMLRRYPQFRGLLASLCPVVGCAVPELHDPARVQVVSRDVRVHPRYEGALLVTAALVNSASFVQPYPHMQFTLFNVNGQSIASRIFAPSEYLAEGVDEAAGMHPQTPLQITLDVLAPNEPAVSFEFRFL